MGKYFGTDGFRGEANDNLTADHAYKVGRFLGWYYGELKRRAGSEEPAKIVIGKDTRRSSYMFEYTLAAGITASGADAYLMHVTTTPSVAYIARVDGFDCGIMISASHNPYYDNGIKLINGQGEKMDEETIALVEAYIDGELELFGQKWETLPFGQREKVGVSVDYASGRNRYIGYLISLGLYSFKDVRVGLDCANGAAWNIAKSVFDALGAKTYVINADPDGVNINTNAGSTHIDNLRRFGRKPAGFFRAVEFYAIELVEYGNMLRRRVAVDVRKRFPKRLFVGARAVVFHHRLGACPDPFQQNLGIESVGHHFFGQTGEIGLDEHILVHGEQSPVQIKEYHFYTHIE